MVGEERIRRACTRCFRPASGVTTRGRSPSPRKLPGDVMSDAVYILAPNARSLADHRIDELGSEATPLFVNSTAPRSPHAVHVGSASRTEATGSSSRRIFARLRAFSDATMPRSTLPGRIALVESERDLTGHGRRARRPPSHACHAPTFHRRASGSEKGHSTLSRSTL